MCSEEILRLVTDINKVCKKLDYKWNINSGGCCFVSRVIAEGLERLKIKYKLVLYYYSDMTDDCASEVRRSIKERNIHTFPNGDDTGSHYAIYIPKIKAFLNKSNRYSKEYYRQMFVSRVNFSDLEWIYNTGSWNDVYDTRYNNPIRKRLNSIFNKYEKEFNRNKLGDEML
jgi:hypothetical protein